LDRIAPFAKLVNVPRRARLRANPRGNLLPYAHPSQKPNKNTKTQNPGYIHRVDGLAVFVGNGATLWMLEHFHPQKFPLILLKLHQASRFTPGEK